jgi:hypothetical protein
LERNGLGRLNEEQVLLPSLSCTHNSVERVVPPLAHTGSRNQGVPWLTSPFTAAGPRAGANGVRVKDEIFGWIQHKSCTFRHPLVGVSRVGYIHGRCKHTDKNCYRELEKVFG